MMRITCQAPAKLNLFLHITGRRADGYHDICSVFSAIDLADELTFSDVAGTGAQVRLQGADELTADVRDNLITRAAMLLAQHYPNQVRPVSITLTKRIPTGAGLGGGSSDAATTLLALNQLWGLGLDVDTLITYGAQLGADVPFFIFAHKHQCSALASGIGDKLTAIMRPASHYLLLLPDAHIATAALFSHAELERSGQAYDLDALSTANLDDEMFYNAFEPLVVASTPMVADALTYLRSLEPRTGSRARMTGTGSAVFLPVSNGVMASLSEADKQAMADHAPCRALWVKDLYGS